MTGKPKIYVAGPYSKGNVLSNIKNAIEVGDWLLGQGFVPFIPHLTGFWDLVSSHEYEEWLSYDFQWILSCDALLRIFGESIGADREVKFAKDNNIPVFTDSKDLVEYFGKVW